MQIRDINKPITSRTLNETLAKKFGTRLDTDNFTLEQLQDARNKVRTKLSQIETNESFGGLPKNQTYSKNKLFLDILNAAISERADVDESKDQDDDGDKDFADVQIARMVKSGMSKADAIKKVKDKDYNEGAYGKKKKRKMSEGAEDHAELVMAAKDMVDRLTGWMEDTAEMQTESMLELADAIRDEMGSEQSQQFVQSIKPALEGLYASMEQAREALSAGVGLLTGEQMPATELGAEPEMAADADMEPTVDQEEALPADEFGAAAPAAGGAEPAARPARESVDPRKLGKVLASSKKK